MAGRRRPLVLPIAMLLTIWAGVGYYSVIFLAGLQNIPEELYDAARIDGCNDLQKHRYVSVPGLRPQIVFVAVISSLAALKVFDEIYVLTNRTGGILDSGVTMVFYLWEQAFQLQHAGYASAIAIVLLVDHAGLLDRQRPRCSSAGGGGRMSVAGMSPADRRRSRADRARPVAAGAATAASSGGWYVVLTAIAVVTVFPFVWMLLTSLKGPPDPITSVPPQFIPADPTLANYGKVLGQPADPDASSSTASSSPVGDRAAQRAGRGAGGLPAGEDALPGPRGDLLPAARRR